ncbi:MAG: EAL domain-containing protein [Alphaproteobacteria bacterium]|nr:EAL domain-containing protein [Alphaproteobacteria bacterium]
MSIIRLGDHKIFAKGTPAQYLKGTVILESGKVSHRIYLLKKGVVSIVDSTGRKIEYSKPLSLFGWESCFFDEPNTYTITTEDHCHFVVLTKQELDEALLSKSDEIRRLSFYSFQTSMDLFCQFSNKELPVLTIQHPTPEQKIDPLQELIQLFINNFITHHQTAELLDQQMRTALTLLGTFVDVEHIVLYQFERETEKLIPQYVWVDSDDKEPLTEVMTLSMEATPYFFNRLLHINDVIISDSRKDLKAESQDKNELDKANVTSCLFLPLAHQDELSSVLCLATSKMHGKWDNARLSLLKMLHAILEREIERIQKDIELEKIRPVDKITGLPNRNFFLSLLKTALNTTARSRKKAAVLFIHLDYFKRNYGHYGKLIQNNIIKAVADRFQELDRKGDILGHFHEDEFVLALTGLSHKNDARIIANRLVDVLEIPVDVMAKSYHVAASIGVSIYPDQGKTPIELVEIAEEAMYRASDIAGTSYVFAEPRRPFLSEVYEKIESEIKFAVKNEGILTYFQPILDLKTKRVVGAEVLSRWHKKDDSIALPEEFLSICEQSGLIVQLSEKILKDTCHNMVEWQKAGYELNVSLNVSMRWLVDQNFITIIRETIEEYGIKPELLSIELTEGILLRDIDRAQEILGQLRDIGVKLCLDDFGTGYSSLSFLHQLPIDTIKIDKQFIHHLSDQHSTAQLVKGLVKLGHELDMTIIAEGIETAEQEKFMLDAGCLYGQGFFYHKAMPALDFSKLLSLNTKR